MKNIRIQLIRLLTIFCSLTILPKLSCSQIESHCNTLGLLPIATPREVKKAYHSLARKYHPDKASSDQLRKQYTTRMQKINEACGIKLLDLFQLAKKAPVRTLFDTRLIRTSTAKKALGDLESLIFSKKSISSDDLLDKVFTLAFRNPEPLPINLQKIAEFLITLKKLADCPSISPKKTPYCYTD